MTRKEVATYIKEKHGIEPDYPWIRSPNYAIFRHRHNRKWFAAIMDITADKLGMDGYRHVDVMNLKCDPVLIGTIRQRDGIFPAYHMNKEHWITVLLNDTVPKEEICSLIDMSFALTG